MISFNEDVMNKSADELSSDDIRILVDCLNLIDDKLRYKAFLLLSDRAEKYDDVFYYMKIMKDKLKSGNSYQRSIGLMLIAINSKWDKELIIDGIIDDYLASLYDEKPITVRQCIQHLAKIIPYHKHLSDKIAAALMSINISRIKETMQKSILTDILNILLIIRKIKSNNEIEDYIVKALNGGLIDIKTKKNIVKELI